MLRRTACIATLFLVGWTTSTPSRADLITNGSFEAGAFVNNGQGAMSLAPGSTVINGWTTFNAELAWIDDANIFDVLASDGVKHLDLAGYHDVSPFGGVQQTIATTVGQGYRLEFDLGTNPIYGLTQSLTASAGGTSGLFTFTALPTGGMQWQRFGLDFTAASASTVVSLVGSLPSGVHIGLDNVSVAAAVPEPSSLGMLGTGVLGLLAYARQRRRANGA